MARTQRPPLNADQIRSLLDFNVETGDLRWTAAASLGRLTGRLAGSVGNCGYRQIKVGGRMYLAHRLAWLIVNGNWPHGQIDHVDGNRLNNALINLRDVSSAQNKQNIAVIGRKSQSGLVGAVFRPGGNRRRDRWEARIKVSGKSQYLGQYATPEEAHAAYVAAKARVHPYHMRVTAL